MSVDRKRRYVADRVLLTCFLSQLYSLHLISASTYFDAPEIFTTWKKPR